MKILTRIGNLFRRDKLEAEMTEEMRHHVELQTELNIKAGMKPEDAGYAALRQFGNMAVIQERVREAKSWVWLELWGKDLVFAVRSLRKNPGFTVVVVLTIALGIGANTAVFTVIDALLLRTLPVTQPELLVVLAAAGPLEPKGDFPYSLFDHDGSNAAFPYPFYEWFQGQSRTMAEIMAVSGWVMDRPMVASGFGATEVESVTAEEVTGNYFSTVGISTALGRTLTPEDDRAGKAEAVVVISHDFWERRFGSDPGVLGKILRLDNVPVTIVGVLARGFTGAQVGVKVNLWFPIQLSPRIDGNMPWDGALKSDHLPWVHILGRLRPGISFAEATAELDALYQGKLAQLDPRRKGPGGIMASRGLLEQKIEITPAGTGYGGVRPSYLKPTVVLIMIVGVMQLVACANVAGLLLARGSARQREFAVRSALGASRGRLVLQLMTESLLLAGLAGLLGLLLAEGSTRFLASYVDGLELEADRRVLLFSFAAALATGFIFGLVPALRLSRRDLTGSIKDQSGVGRQRLNFTLVITQIGFAFVLLAVAGLFARTLQNLSSIETGFQRPHRQLFDLNITPDYTMEQRLALYQRVTDAVGVLPGVVSVTAYQGLDLLGEMAFAQEFSASGYTPARDEDLHAMVTLIGPRFFETMGIPLRRGRDFGVREEGAKSHGVSAMVISEWSARKLYGEADPIGRRIKLGGDEFEIVGVAGNVKYSRLREAARFVVYVPILQRPNSARMSFAVNVNGTPGNLAAILQKVVSQLDARVQITGLRTIEEKLDDAVRRERLVAHLAGFFGTFALLLSCMGLFGLLSYNVSRRTREIGIRMALGAPPGGIILLIAGLGFRLGLLGCAVGLLAAAAVTRLVASLLYGVTSVDLPTFTAATVLLLLVALLASLLPALRATKVAPTVALRAE